MRGAGGGHEASGIYRLYRRCCGNVAVYSTCAAAGDADRRIFEWWNARGMGIICHRVSPRPDRSRLCRGAQCIEFRWAEGLIDRVPRFIADLTQRQVAVVFVGGSDAVVLAAKTAISTIPIVFATGGDPVDYGLVASMNRPGGNATGVTVITAALWPKRLELLRELVSSPGLFGVLVNPSHPSSAASTKEVREAAHTLGQEILVVNVRTERDFDTAFSTLVQNRVSGLLVANDPLFTGRREQLIALASQHAIPTVYDRPEFTKAGGLMSYGASTVEQYRQAGFYTGRVLKGEKPADLPVLQPTKFELSVNLKTAKALGLRVPPSLLVAADEVIE
jgi:putative ABC transport system substrate-binding protein